METVIERLIETTNAEDREGFLDLFTPQAVVDDFGRVFRGRDEIAGWSDREHIGTHNRLRVTSLTERKDGTVVLGIVVSGHGYNGPGSFAVRVSGDRVASLVIRG